MNDIENAKEVNCKKDDTIFHCIVNVQSHARKSSLTSLLSCPGEGRGGKFSVICGGIRMRVVILWVFGNHRLFV